MSTFIVTWYEGGSFAMNPTPCGTTKIKCADLTAAITKASSILSGKLKTEKAPDNACGFYVKVQIWSDDGHVKIDALASSAK